MPSRPSRVIRSSELRAQRGKPRQSLRAELNDQRAQLTKVAEEARRKQAFYDYTTFYRDVAFTQNVVIEGDLQLPGAVDGDVEFNDDVLVNGILATAGNVVIEGDIDLTFGGDILMNGAIISGSQAVSFVGGVTVSLLGVPTSSAGLPSGGLWRDAGAGDVIKMVP